MDILTNQFAPLGQAPVLLPVLFDYFASFIWALSGALIAARRGLVLIGVLTIAIVSATGGGLLRDGLLLRVGTPAILENPVYILLAIGAALLVQLFGGSVDRSKYVPPAVHFVDALGAGTYAVVGVDRAIAADLPLVGIIIVGIVNATGGAILRDVMLRRVPELFRPGLPIAMASVLGAVLFALLVTQLDVRHEAAAFATISLVLVLNLIILRLHIRTHPLEAFRKYWDDTA